MASLILRLSIAQAVLTVRDDPEHDVLNLRQERRGLHGLEFQPVLTGADDDIAEIGDILGNAAIVILPVIAGDHQQGVQAFLDFAQHLGVAGFGADEGTLGNRLIQAIGEAVVADGDAELIGYPAQQVVRDRVRFGEVRLIGDDCRLVSLLRPGIVVLDGQYLRLLFEGQQDDGGIILRRHALDGVLLDAAEDDRRQGILPDAVQSLVGGLLQAVVQLLQGDVHPIGDGIQAAGLDLIIRHGITRLDAVVPVDVADDRVDRRDDLAVLQDGGGDLLRNFLAGDAGVGDVGVFHFGYPTFHKLRVMPVPSGAKPKPDATDERIRPTMKGKNTRAFPLVTTRIACLTQTSIDTRTIIGSIAIGQRIVSLIGAIVPRMALDR